MLALSFPLWYAVPGIITAIAGVSALFWKPLKRALTWVAIRMMNMAVGPLEDRIEQVDDRADEADDRIGRIEDMVGQILAEVKPNGGGSMKDKVNLLVVNQTRITDKVDTLAEQMAEHRGYHEGRDH